MSSVPIPCPVCGHNRATDGICERCGVAFSGFVKPSRDAEPGDVTGLLRGLAIAAGVLLLLVVIGAALILRQRIAPGPEQDAGLLTTELPTAEPAAAELPEELPAELPSEPTPEDPRPAGGLTAAELLAQGEDAEPTGIPTGIPLPPPEWDESTAERPEVSLAIDRPVRPGWYDGADGYRTAIEQRALRAAPMVLYFRTDWCPYCRRFDEEYLANQDVANWLSAAQRVQVNPESGADELALARRFGVRGYPAFFVIRADEGEARRVHPYRKGRSISVGQFLVELKQAAGES